MTSQTMIKVFNLLNTRSASFLMFTTDQYLKVSEIKTSNSPVWRERWLWSIELRWERRKDDVGLIQRGAFHIDEIMMLCLNTVASLSPLWVCILSALAHWRSPSPTATSGIVPAAAPSRSGTLGCTEERTDLSANQL